MDDEQIGYMGVTRWVSFSHHGEPESGEARTMDDGSVWARIAGPDPKGDDDRWVMLLILPASKLPAWMTCGSAT